jgi:hypothetical protein
LLRIKYGTGLVFQGERNSPYGLMMSLKAPASVITWQRKHTQKVKEKKKKQYLGASNIFFKEKGCFYIMRTPAHVCVSARALVCAYSMPSA